MALPCLSKSCLVQEIWFLTSENSLHLESDQSGLKSSHFLDVGRKGPSFGVVMKNGIATTQGEQTAQRQAMTIRILERISRSPGNKAQSYFHITFLLIVA